MDPLTQGVLGAAACGALARKADLKRPGLTAVMVVGAIAGMVADLDALVLATGDSFLYLKYHRHFSHSLVFIPIGALFSALACYWLYFKAKASMRFGRLYLYSFIGYATHGLLDCTTTYGTHLLWPFSDERISWGMIGVIDPAFTIIALLLVILGMRMARRRWAGVAIIWMLSYLGVGWLQNGRALTGVTALAMERGHRMEMVWVIPTIGTNLLLWRTIYRHGDRFYVDAVGAGVNIKLWPGATIDVYQQERHLPWLNPDSQQAQDVETFKKFADELLAPDPKEQNSLIDLRYAGVPNEASSVWRILLSPHKGRADHAEYRIDRRIRDSIGKVWKMLTTSSGGS